MAIFICKQCGETKETRCKPKKCPQCGGVETFIKQEDAKK